MSKRLFVGSIAWGTTNDGLKRHFEQVGPVEEATVLMDKMTGRSRGFGFVTMANDADGDAAVSKLNGSELDGRKLVVSEARPREERAQM
ncbi:RNA-binding protein [Patescibacteria group bacterium]|nr:RNA-binding protein [Patescibacteria group bacterium]MDE1946387.1 RNA-binding protein [Patescibacteria group bacterium]MDE2010839.1 RNA-binding protein [Patescibacteria group bacterium]MDE2233101.1 RNA-binding protein [Patescibacteria group bacterium]